MITSIVRFNIQCQAIKGYTQCPKEKCGANLCLDIVIIQVSADLISFRLKQKKKHNQFPFIYDTSTAVYTITCKLK
jgi:hypothetical protein